MCTNDPMFGPVILESTCTVFIDKELKHVSAGVLKECIKYLLLKNEARCSYQYWNDHSFDMT